MGRGWVDGALLATVVWAAMAGAGRAQTLREYQSEVRAAVNGGRPPDAISAANRMVEAFSEEPEAFFTRAKMWWTFRNFNLAVEDLDQALELNPDNPTLLRERGLYHFLAGKPKESAEDFDRYIENVPWRKPYLWQRGISLYYAGRYQEGHDQFIEHQRVNGSDVENIFWNFICQARAQGLAAARAELLDWDGADQRVPMAEIFGLLAQEVTPEQLLEVAETTDLNNDQRRRNHQCYAHLYLGLYFEVVGDPERGAFHIEKAAKDFAMGHYMGDVARVHWDLLQSGAYPVKNEAPVNIEADGVVEEESP